MKKIILLGFNELNFPFIEKYIQLGYLKNFKKYVSFVAIKNGEHNSTGYLVDTSTYSNKENQIPLKSVFYRIVSCLGNIINNID